MSLKQIYNYWSDCGISLLPGQTTYSGGGVSIDILTSELKKLIALVSYIILSTAAYAPNLRHFRKVCNKSIVKVVLGGYI